MTPNNQTIVKFSIVGLILPILASPLVNFILVSQGPKRVDDRGFIVGSYTFSEYYQILITNPPKLPEKLPTNSPISHVSLQVQSDQPTEQHPCHQM